MRAPPEDFEVGPLLVELAEGWGLEDVAAEYAAVGGGSYHWVVDARDARRVFVTVDDLARKPWLGDDPGTAFEGLAQAFGTAAALHGEGLDFVAAPLPTSSGETLRRVGPRHTVAVFPFVDGRPGKFGHYEAPERAGILAMLARLHRAAPRVPAGTRRIDLGLAGRRELEAALAALDGPWSSGPFGEPAREALAQHAAEVAELLGLFDRLADEVAARNADWVVTHGEPHGGNVMRTEDGFVLIDWDTVALAPRERDLWMLLDDAADDSFGYSDATGSWPDQVGLHFFRLMWDLADLAAFTHLLRSPHRRTADTAQAYDSVTYYVTVREQWAPLLG